MILLDVTVQAHADTADGMADLLRRTMVASRAEPGCVHYRFSRDLDDPLLFHLFELWADESALMAHGAGKPFLDFLAALPSVGSLIRSQGRQGELADYRFRRPAANA